MKQVIRKGLKEIIVDEVPDPLPSPHHVVVQPVFSLISSGTETASIHTDSLFKEVADNPSHLHKIWSVAKEVGPLKTAVEVRAKFSDYAVLGYSGAGFIIEKHPTVADLEVGARVAYGGEGTGHGERIVTGRNLVARVPDSVGFDEACFATLGSIALNSVRIASISLGETVAVIGQGLVGQLIAQLARLQGGVVIAIDLLETRVSLAKSIGAEYGIVAGDGSAAMAIQSITNGKGVDCAIVAAAAKSSAPCKQALEICRDRGRIVVVGAVDMSFPWNDMYLKEIQLLMARAYGPGSYDAVYEKRGQDYPYSYVRWTENRNMAEFLRLIDKKKVQVGPLVSHRLDLNEAPKAYETIMDPAQASMAVLLRYPAEELSRQKPKRRVDIVSNTSKSGLQVALVGAGNLAKWEHLPNLQRISGVQLKAVHSSSPARGKSYGIRFGATYCCTDYQEILNDREIDVVVITSRNPEHAHQTQRALEAGKHVFVEKPMALTEEECHGIYRAAATSKCQVAVGFNRRYAPYYRELKSLLKRRPGPGVVQCRINSPGISGDYWMADPSIGGAILGEACHFIDLMYWLLESEPVEVSAWSLPTGQKNPIGENNMVASFRFADGSIGNLTYCTVGSKTSGGERVEVFAQGLGGFAEDFKRLGLRTGIRRNKKMMWAQKGYEAQMREFLDGVRQGKSTGVNVLDGIRATLGCLRMMESARKGTSCKIELDSLARE